MANNSRTHNEGNRMNTITSCISTTLLLVLLGAVVFFVCFAHNFSQSLQENFTITLILDAEAQTPQINEVKKRVSQMQCTRNLTYISKEQALREETEALGTDPSEFLGYNPLPAAFELALKAEYANTDSLKKIIPTLQSDPLVVEVTAPQDLMDDLNHNIRRVSTILLGVALLLTLVSFVLINNTIRMAVHSRRHRIKTMRLVGASYGFIRRPFIIKAFVIGITSSLVAIVVLAGGIAYLVQYEPDVINLINWQTLVATAGAVLISGLFVTWVSAHFSVNRYMSKKAADIYRT